MKPSDKSKARSTSAAGSTTGAGSSFHQPEQSLGTQINVGHDAQIQLHGSSPVSLPPASPNPPRVPRKPSEVIQDIEREFACQLRALERCYVIPDVQDFNPPDEMNSPSLIVSRQPAFQVVDEFVARPSLTEIGQRCLFVLGDAGMGKTSLLLMLARRYLSSRPSNGYECVLLKLGADTLDRIAAIPQPARTLLLLDSLDEDSAAHDHLQGAEGRLLELLPRLVQFHRILLTCRTQFFPETSRHLTTLAGHFVVGAYECPLKYLSLFNDAQVEQYLRKRYQPSRVVRLLQALVLGGADDPKLAEARQAAKSMESLRLRPLLLSRIDDFLGHDGQPCVDFHNRYAVYHRLVDQWLMRDAQKHLGLTPAESWRVAMLLALHLARQGTRMISRETLAQIEGLREIPRFKVEARSLLNRNKDYQYQFAHATIQEFLLAHAILDQSGAFDVAGLQLSRETWQFLAHGSRFLGRKAVDARGARANFPEAAVEFIRQVSGVELVAILPGEFLMGSPTGERGRSSDEIQHGVRLTRPFWIGRYPVTQAEFEAVMGDNSSQFKGPRRPVENVDWDQALAFCRKLTEQARSAGCLPQDFAFRLPTEAEWEYACRAGTTSAFNDGSNCTVPDRQDPALKRLGWHGEGSKGQTHPVGEKLPNASDLYDMHGNVWEWCADHADWKDSVVTDTYEEGTVDPICEKGARRVIRGGSFWYEARSCRSAFRFAIEPGLRDRNLGFRLAAGQEPGRGAPSPAAVGAVAPGPEAPRRRAGERSEPAGTSNSPADPHLG